MTREPAAFRHRILVVEDDEPTREAVVALLETAGHEVEGSASAEEALDRLAKGSFHLALIDHRLPGKSGTELASIVLENAPMTAVVLITGHGSLPHAVEAMKLGAVDYVAKPLDASKLEQVVRAALDGRPRWVPNRLLAPDRGPARLDGLVARSKIMRAVFERIREAASSGAEVLLTGESGSGKERVARAIHRAGARAGGPFIALDAGAIPPELLPDEIFGHEKGAFAGATSAREGRLGAAAGGTLYLDEVDGLDARAQAQLFRALETGTFAPIGGAPRPLDARLIAGTRADLAARAAEGAFRGDLRARLASIAIEVPPLRRRREDIAPLAASFLEEIAARTRRPVPFLEEEALRALERHRWPGNVRELKTVIEHAAMLCRGRRLGVALLPRMPEQEGGAPGEIRIPLGTPLSEVERRVILAALAASGGDERGAARALGIATRVLREKLRGHAAEAVPGMRVDGADPVG